MIAYFWHESPFFRELCLPIIEIVIVYIRYFDW